MRIRFLIGAIVLVIVSSLSIAGCTINFNAPSTPTPTKNLTGDFYTALSLKNVTTDLNVNQTGRVTVRIDNRENANADYKLVVTFENKTINSTSFSLPNNQTWQDSIAFTPTQRGLGQKLNFDLYKDGDSNVYRNVYLNIDVT